MSEGAARIELAIEPASPARSASPARHDQRRGGGRTGPVGNGRPRAAAPCIACERSAGEAWKHY